jgi:hypothetical protein
MAHHRLLGEIRTPVPWTKLQVRFDLGRGVLTAAAWAWIGLLILFFVNWNELAIWVRVAGVIVLTFLTPPIRFLLPWEVVKRDDKEG